MKVYGIWTETCSLPPLAEWDGNCSPYCCIQEHRALSFLSCQVESCLPRSAFLILPQLPVAETKFLESAAERWSPRPFTQHPPPPPPPRDRGSTMDMAPWKIEEPQLPSPWPLGCRFYSGRGKLRIAGAAVLLSPQQALKAVSPREKHGIVFVPRAQIVPRGTSKPYSRDLWISPKRNQHHLQQSVKCMPEGAGCGERNWREIDSHWRFRLTRRLASLLERKGERGSWEEPFCG